MGTGSLSGEKMAVESALSRALLMVEVLVECWAAARATWSEAKWEVQAGHPSDERTGLVLRGQWEKLWAVSLVCEWVNLLGNALVAAPVMVMANQWVSSTVSPSAVV